ncbi:hypothetical protein NEOLEDRAFT_1178726 [Neolentinus lepideus HHB14362 ss-1]|uniref:Uncharacterized protein n=1 Tax=Neolentinus lepideus HHB14362 ss-1 TaxID=1314782 RepID=A0A165SCG5_9AGAM|nr:hypothetical protein NEOLEDRAFT_1178726 [Neolentinus lepideus HHB14362 ss-1]
MVSTSKLSRQLNRIALSWPYDAFRPNLQLKTFLSSLSTHPGLTADVVEAARALSNNEISKQYPLPPNLLKPASMPHHYTRLVEGFEKSAKGIGRPWWKVFFGIW